MQLKLWQFPRKRRSLASNEPLGLHMGWRHFVLNDLSSRFVLMCAINCREFADYFAVPVQNKMNPAYVFEVEGKPFSIEGVLSQRFEHVHHSRVCWNALFVYSECTFCI